MKHNYYYIQNFLNKKQIKEVNSFMHKEGKEFSEQASTIKKASTTFAPYERIEPLINLSSAISFVNKEAFGFDIYPPDRGTNFLHHKYEDKNKGRYDFHMDSEPYDTNYTLKLTSILNLSEQPYKGGELLLYLDCYEIEIKEFNVPGTLVVFPSFFLHKVTPVTEGTRISGVYLVHGPWWR